jgi:hypothetical protein
MAILVRDCVYSISVPLHTTLQAVAARVNLGALPFTICNIYLPPTFPIADLVRLLAQLPTPFVQLVDSMVDHFTNAVLQAAAMNIPRSSIRPRRIPVPWWTDECGDTIRARKHALRQFQIQPTQENLVSFKRLCLAARRTIRSAKRRFWEAYVSSLSRSTPSDVV